MKDGQKITFSQEGDQEPGIPAGDIIVVLDEQEHPVFTRKGYHLYMRMELELVEALCGFQKTITTLDNRTLLITVLPGKIVRNCLSLNILDIFFYVWGEIIKHMDYRCVPKEGMPHYRNPCEKGNLIIQFIVHFPPQNFLPPAKVREPVGWTSVGYTVFVHYEDNGIASDKNWITNSWKRSLGDKF